MYLELIEVALKPGQNRGIVDLTIVVYRLRKGKIFVNTFFDASGQWCVVKIHFDIQFTKLCKCPICDIAGTEHDGVFIVY